MYSNINELHAQEERSRNQAIENITGISKKYYDTLYDICSQIVEFKNALYLDSYVKRVLKGFSSSGNERDCQLILDRFFCVDAVRCFNEMRIPIDSEKKEFIGLLVFSLKFVEDDTIKYFLEQYEYLPGLLERVSGDQIALCEQLNTFSDNIGKKGTLFVTTVLQKGSDQFKKYFTLMYRWALLVSKADKTTTKQEQLWLSKLKDADESLIMKLDKTDESDENIEVEEDIMINNPIEELKNMIGLSSVKKEVETLYNFVQIQQKRERMGMKTSAVSYHCIFTGNAGTGKTTVARIVAQIYKELGVLKKGHLVETDRSGLVAEYVGQTAIKTNKIIDSALDGVLFIDEAYALSQGGREDFGKEAISTLIKRMEDDRNRLVVILAGYDEDMSLFLNSNPGIKSRINRYIHFPDYSEDELFEIFMSLAKNSEYHITSEAQAKLRFIIEAELEKKDPKFGNARFIRNIFEKTIEHQANRLSLISDITPELLSTITDSDL